MSEESVSSVLSALRWPRHGFILLRVTECGHSHTEVTRKQGHTPPHGPTVGLNLGAYNLPRDGVCPYSRVTYVVKSRLGAGVPHPPESISFYGRACRWAMFGELKPKGPKECNQQFFLQPPPFPRN